MFEKKYRRFIFIAPLIAALSLTGAVEAQEHTATGTIYGNHGVDIYAKTRHGPDGALFLDPYFLPYLQDSQGQILLDAGCGAGPWAIFAAENGATVFGIDLQENMIEKAKLAALEANVVDKTTFEVGDVGSLPYPDDFFDRAVSLNVGCNLPFLESHVRELKRVLKKGGSALITAPSSFEVVFTDGNSSSEKMTDVINQLLSSNSQERFPIAAIQRLDEVYRATFAKREGKWVLVLDEKDLIPGEDIWRKIPKMVVPNRYHSEREYLSLFEAEGLLLKYIAHPKFLSEQERLEYNINQECSLGTSYLNSSPFAIFIVEKQ